MKLVYDYNKDNSNWYLCDNDSSTLLTADLIMQHPELVESYCTIRIQIHMRWHDDIINLLSPSQIIELQLKGFSI